MEALDRTVGDLLMEDTVPSGATTGFRIAAHLAPLA